MKLPFWPNTWSKPAPPFSLLPGAPNSWSRRLNALEHAPNAERSGDKRRGVAVSLADPGGVRRAMEAFDSQLNRVDILVNDARSMLARPMIEISP